MPGDSHPTPNIAARRGRRVCAGAEAGFTLIEIMASALIIVVIAAGVAQALISGAHLSGYQKNRSQADQVAQQDQERLRGMSAKQLSSLATAQTYAVTQGTTNYTVSSQASLLSSSGSTSCTSTGASAVAYYRTVSTASWKDNGGSHSVTEDSIITPPAGGELLAQVDDQTGNPLSGVTITATGQSTGGDQESGSSDSNGCVIFTGLASDTYSVSFNSTGYVDKDGNSPLTDTATVSDSGTARPTNNIEYMGQAGTISAYFSTQAYTSSSSTTVGTVSNQVSPNVSYYGAGATQSMSSMPTVSNSSGATSYTLTNLYPFYFSGSSNNYTSNYHVWNGACRQEEPPSAYDTANVSPGSSQTLIVQEPALNLTFNWSGSRATPAHVSIKFASTSGTSCTDTWHETIASGASTSTNGVLAYPGVPYASTATTGSTASASGQTGTLTVCADYKSGTTSYYGSITPTVQDYTAPTAASISLSSSSSKGTCP